MAPLGSTIVHKEDVNVLHAGLCHPLEVITQSTGRAIDIHLTGVFNPCEDCAPERQKMAI